MTIEDYLSEEEKQLVVDHIQIGATYQTIRSFFPHFDKKQATLFFDYYKRLRNELTSSGPEFGAKDEPYYKSEDYDELHPQYTWKDLSLAEKSWYNVRVKNKIKC